MAATLRSDSYRLPRHRPGRRLRQRHGHLYVHRPGGFAVVDGHHHRAAQLHVRPALSTSRTPRPAARTRHTPHNSTLATHAGFYDVSGVDVIDGGITYSAVVETSPVLVIRTPRHRERDVTCQSRPTMATPSPTLAGAPSYAIRQANPCQSQRSCSIRSTPRRQGHQLST